MSQPKKLVQALEQLPPTMEDIYDDILQRINESSPADQELAIKGLSWVFHTTNAAGSRQLTIDEILDLIVTEVGDNEVTEEDMKSTPDNLINACRGLVVIDTATNTIRFPHATVLEYFRVTTHLKPLSYLGSVTLTYLGFDEFGTECSDWSDVYRRAEKYKAIKFLSKYWGIYIKDCQTDEGTQEAVFNWLNSKGKPLSALQMEVMEDETWRREVLESGFGLLDQTIIQVLVRKDLDILLDLFLDSKTAIKQRYRLVDFPLI